MEGWSIPRAIALISLLSHVVPIASVRDTAVVRVVIGPGHAQASDHRRGLLLLELGLAHAFNGEEASGRAATDFCFE